MKRALLIIVSLLFGICVGWYFGYTRPVAKQYRMLRDELHVTDHDMVAMGKDWTANRSAIFDAMKRSDDMVTALALASLIRLDRGDIDGTKKLLLPHVGFYYRRYHGKNTGDAKLLQRIEDAAREHPEMAAEIAKDQ